MARDLTALYKIASDPSSTQKQLKKVWEETKSSKVRKAVASNLNCDPDTLRMAARLYLREVVENPSFEMLKLFDQDPFISKLFDAYEKPDTYATANKRDLGRYTKDSEILARTLLLSPSLSSHSTINIIYNALGITEIKRELRDESVKDRVRRIIVPRGNTALFKNLDNHVVLDLYNTGIITLPEFEQFLNTCRHQTLSASSGGSVKRLIESQLTNISAQNYELIFKLMVACNSYTIRATMKSLLTSSCGHKFLSMVAMLYKDFVYFDVMRLRQNNKKAGYYGYYANSNFTSYQIHSVMWKFLKLKHLEKDSESWGKVNFTSFMRDLDCAGLITPHVLYQPKLKFRLRGEENFSTRLKVLEGVLGITSDTHFVYAAVNLLGGEDFYPKALPGSVDHNMVERINQINERLFKEGKEPLVKYSDLTDFHPTYIFNSPYECREYPLRNCDKDSPTPPTSGMIDKSVIENYVKLG